MGTIEKNAEVLLSVYKDIGLGISTMNWVDSAKVRDYWTYLVNAVLNLRVP